MKSTRVLARHRAAHPQTSTLGLSTCCFWTKCGSHHKVDRRSVARNVVWRLDVKMSDSEYFVAGQVF